MKTESSIGQVMAYRPSPNSDEPTVRQHLANKLDDLDRRSKGLKRLMTMLSEEQLSLKVSELAEVVDAFAAELGCY